MKKCKSLFNYYIKVLISFDLYILSTNIAYPQIIRVFQDSNNYYSLYIRPLGDSQYCSVSSIKIFKLKDSSLSQEITPSDDNYFYCDSSSTIFKLIDVNFDGYNDIQLFQTRDTKGNDNVLFYYWIYNPIIKKFEENNNLESLTSPKFDPQTKTIITHYHTANSFNNEVYKIIKNKLLLIKKTEGHFVNEKNGNKYIITTTERIDGKMKVIKQENE